jgi:hypothetical protein
VTTLADCTAGDRRLEYQQARPGGLRVQELEHGHECRVYAVAPAPLGGCRVSEHARNARNALLKSGGYTILEAVEDLIECGLTNPISRDPRIGQTEVTRSSTSRFCWGY